MQTICSNLNLLSQYNEADLAILKTGTVPASQKPVEPVAEVAANETNAATENATSLQLVSENNNAEIVATTVVTETPQTSETTVATQVTSEHATSAAVVDLTPAEDVATAKEIETNQNNTAAEVKAAAAEVVRQVTQENPETPAVTYTTRAETANSVKSQLVTEEVVVVKEPVEVDGQKYTDRVNEIVEVVTVAPVADNAPAAAPATQPKAPAEGRAKASANAADYYYSMPSEVVADLFARTGRGVYSDARPIPIDMEMPKGVYYKVQIGAFRNDIPQNLYDEFAPISGERLNSGITRYTAGFFVQFENAKQVKQEIRALGYSDAFIVAYRDGKRIPLYEAAAITDGPELAASIKAAFDKAAVGSVAQNTGTAQSASANNAPANNAANAAAIAAIAAAKTNEEIPAITSVADTTITPTNNTTAPVRKPNVIPLNAVNVDAEVAAEMNKKPATRTVAEIEAAAAQPKNTDYYNAEETNAAKAQQVEAVQGLFYTIQVGVYSKPVAAALLQNVNPLNSELTETGKIRYTSGQFNNMEAAVTKRTEVRELGIVDAFITAYYNGNRINLSEADLLIKEKGQDIFAK